MRLTSTISEIIAVTFVLSNIIVKGNSSQIVGNYCPKGKIRIGGYCLVDDDEYAGEYFKTTPEVKCIWLPYYQCQYQYIWLTTSTKGKSSEVCCQVDSPPEETCGWGTAGPEEAAEVEYGEFPWMVALLTIAAGETWTGEELIGGGAIIHPRAVLTAAHKVQMNSMKMVKCRAGEWSRTAPESHAPQDRLISSINIHPKYEKRYMANDLAVLGLQEPFDLSPTVRPVCVGQGQPRVTECFAMGWGLLRSNSSDYADKLKKVLAPPVPRAVCWRALQAVDERRRRARGLRPAEQLELHASLRCAGGSRDLCAGDGGSPLVCPIQANATHARWAVFGLAAWGVGCGERGAPGVYADVAYSRDWILSTV